MPRKTFQNGYPLPASDLNTYLMDQSVQTYASAAARTSALATPVEGQVTYLEDTNLLYVWDGSAWTAINTIADGSITNAKLANSSVTVNGSSVALGASTTLDIGRNKIINGAFDFWQRGTTFVNPSSDTYLADRWTCYTAGGARTISQQTFTPGSAPIAGYEGQYYLRMACSSAGTSVLKQKIEDVRTFAGQTVTISFFAKADAARTPAIQYYQQFGSGGSGTVNAVIFSPTLTTSWARYSATFTLPSVSGKTIGANSALQFDFDFGTSVQTIDIWGVQVEAGSVATPFQRAAATLAGELAACQRYCVAFDGIYPYSIPATGWAYSTGGVRLFFHLPVNARVVPTSIDYTAASAWNLSDVVNAGVAVTSFTYSSGDSTVRLASINATVASGLTQYRPYSLQGSASASNAKFIFNMEL